MNRLALVLVECLVQFMASIQVFFIPFVFADYGLSYANCLVLLDCRDPVPSESIEGPKVASFLSWGRSHILLVCFPIL